jgi:hypothetical protein
MKKLIIILSAIALLGCNHAAKKQADNDDIPFSIVEKDSVVFDDETFSRYKHGFHESPPVEYDNVVSEKQYQVQLFITENLKYYSTERYLIDSIPLENGMYSLIISDWEKDNHSDFLCQACLVNYSADNKYIDSRIIYRQESTGKNVYSKLYLHKRKLVIFDNDNYGAEYWEVPVIIRKDGTFEDLPDIPFSKESIAIANCSGSGFTEKFPLNEKWTTVNFTENQIKTFETKRNGYDLFHEVCTHFSHEPMEEPVVFDVAFKGVYTKKEIEILKMTQENNEEIADFVKQNVPQEIDSLQSEVTNIKLYPFVHNGDTFWIVYYSFKLKDDNCDDYTALLGITPNRQVSVLANYCVYDDSASILRLKDAFLLHFEQISCGREAAFGTHYLYKMDTDFKQIFQKGIYCD